jgi:hypothetical protein
MAITTPDVTAHNDGEMPFLGLSVLAMISRLGRARVDRGWGLRT